MAKQCLYEECKYNQFGGGYCRNHQWCRKDKKIKPLRRTAIPKRSKKQTQILGERRLQTKKDKLFYAEIWEERNHFCYETNSYLGTEPLTTFFHHVLPKQKGAYPEFRYKRWNVVIVSTETHQTTESNIVFTPRIEAYRAFLLAHLDELKKGTLIPDPEATKRIRKNVDSEQGIF